MVEMSKPVEFALAGEVEVPTSLSLSLSLSLSHSPYCSAYFLQTLNYDIFFAPPPWLTKVLNRFSISNYVSVPHVVFPFTMGSCL